MQRSDDVQGYPKGSDRADVLNRVVISARCSFDELFLVPCCIDERKACYYSQWLIKPCKRPSAAYFMLVPKRAGLINATDSPGVRQVIPIEVKDNVFFQGIETGGNMSYTETSLVKDSTGSD